MYHIYNRLVCEGAFTYVNLKRNQVKCLWIVKPRLNILGKTQKGRYCIDPKLAIHIHLFYSYQCCHWFLLFKVILYLLGSWKAKHDIIPCLTSWVYKGRCYKTHGTKKHNKSLFLVLALILPSSQNSNIQKYFNKDDTTFISTFGDWICLHPVTIFCKSIAEIDG